MGNFYHEFKSTSRGLVFLYEKLFIAHQIFETKYSEYQGHVERHSDD